MSAVLITSITAITLALIFYTIGVWAEHRAKILKWNHFVFFALGFVFLKISDKQPVADR